MICNTISSGAPGDRYKNGILSKLLPGAILSYSTLSSLFVIGIINKFVHLSIFALNPRKDKSKLRTILSRSRRSHKPRLFKKLRASPFFLPQREMYIFCLTFRRNEQTDGGFYRKGIARSTVKSDNVSRACVQQAEQSRIYARR